MKNANSSSSTTIINLDICNFRKRQLERWPKQALIWTCLVSIRGRNSLRSVWTVSNRVSWPWGSSAAGLWKSGRFDCFRLRINVYRTSILHSLPRINRLPKCECINMSVNFSPRNYHYFHMVVVDVISVEWLCSDVFACWFESFHYIEC